MRSPEPWRAEHTDVAVRLCEPHDASSTVPTQLTTTSALKRSTNRAMTRDSIGSGTLGSSQWNSSLHCIEMTMPMSSQCGSVALGQTTYTRRKLDRACCSSRVTSASSTLQRVSCSRCSSMPTCAERALSPPSASAFRVTTTSFSGIATTTSAARSRFSAPHRPRAPRCAAESLQLPQRPDELFHKRLQRVM